MRFRPLCLIALAACGSSPSGGGDRTAAVPTADERVRVVYRQYYRGSHIFIMENLAGRNLVELRSKPLRKGQVPVAYVPDEVMRELLREFRRADYHDHAGARPPDPRKFGAVAELTIIDENRRMVSFIRQRKQAGTSIDDYKSRSESYQDCVRAFMAVWNFHRPTLQASEDKNFGTRRVER